MCMACGNTGGCYQWAHLLNFTSEGNSSLIGLAIFPSGSASYISCNTAMLPDTFGNCQLVQWKAEPSVKHYVSCFSMSMTCWQQHYLVVVLAFIMAMVLGLSAARLWFIWRHRQPSLNSYKPVGAVPEQELQPL
ncbi:hypothetical protein SLEP1_g8271 [Rubroshorea leprosula]|uniref:Uncharacterized protein n=1 Tax=Rubroshorea leprosula TaxID=152421 RepID=A0AAV5IB11_9ROSI|nr:hypothetical protein SLEP1_g8271 [Rubroshorea leprosula]